jgi:hypothetical protein
MFDHDDAYQDDQMAVGRGLAFGILFGSLIWAVIIAAAVYMLK